VEIRDIPVDRQQYEIYIPSLSKGKTTRCACSISVSLTVRFTTTSTVLERLVCWHTLFYNHWRCAFIRPSYTAHQA